MEVLYLWAITAYGALLPKRAERATRVELATFTLEGWHSTNWVTPACLTFWVLELQINRINFYESVTHQLNSHSVGGTGFEPVKSYDNRFTVCPSWPLWYPPKVFNQYVKIMHESAASEFSENQWPRVYPDMSQRPELNRRPAVYKTAALPLSYIGFHWASDRDRTGNI